MALARPPRCTPLYLLRHHTTSTQYNATVSTTCSCTARPPAAPAASCRPGTCPPAQSRRSCAGAGGGTAAWSAPAGIRARASALAVRFHGYAGVGGRKVMMKRGVSKRNRCQRLYPAVQSRIDHDSTRKAYDTKECDIILRPVVQVASAYS